MTEFLNRFDRIRSAGFVPTRRRGPTGVGYTLESLMGIEENNSPRGDLMGMEVKAMRKKQGESVERKKINLFLKEPVWQDALTTAQRIEQNGYLDASGKRAWYQAVTSQPNNRKLALRIDRPRQQVLLTRGQTTLGHWSFATLEKRLQEKLSEVVFVEAHVRGRAEKEEFRYTTVTYCAGPSVDRFLRVLEEGDVILELRMHVQPTGRGRNHGTAFRIRQNRLMDLYEVQKQCRPLTENQRTTGGDPDTTPSG